MTRSASLRRTLLALVCLSVTSACTTTMRKAPDYATRMHGVKKIALMPPDAMAMRIVFTGNNEKIPEVAERARAALAEDLTNEVHKHDYLVDRVVIEEPPPAPVVAAVDPPVLPAPAAEALPQVTPVADPATFAVETTSESATLPASETPPGPTPEEVAAQQAAADELRFAATQAQKAAEQALDEMYASVQMRKSDALSYKRSLGPDMNRFAEMVDAEALLFVRYQYVTKSGGEIAKDVAFTVLLAAATLGNVIVIQPTTAARLDVCLVDGATGDVLFANTASVGGSFSDPSLERLATQSMDGFSPHQK